jgi:hypothetical protein
MFENTAFAGILFFFFRYAFLYRYRAYFCRAFFKGITACNSLQIVLSAQ